MQTFGECSINIGGRRRILRGDAEWEGLGGLETAVEGNMDSSVYQTAKTTPVMLKISLEEEEDAVFTKEDLTRSQDITFSEDHNGRIHMMSNAKIAGKVTYSPTNGQLSGFSLACAYADYSRR